MKDKARVALPNRRQTASSTLTMGDVEMLASYVASCVVRCANCHRDRTHREQHHLLSGTGQQDGDGHLQMGLFDDADK